MTSTRIWSLRLLAIGATLAAAPVASARPVKPIARDYAGPNVSPAPPPDQAAPRVNPPTVAPEPVEPPPGPAPEAAPVVQAPPAPEPEPPAVAEVPTEDDGDFSFEVVDLTEDQAALAEELKVETKTVKGAAGTVSGTVKDAVTGEPLIGVYVEAIGTAYKTKTGPDGSYQMDLPVGTYELRIRADASEPRRISQVVIEEGRVRDVDAELEPLQGAGQTVLVEAEMNRESEGARLLQRKESTSTRDLMSREEMSRSGGGATSAVAKRIVGATLIDNRFIFVRGLGHRYGNTLFDGARVPSPEPELRTLPLDIFPSSALSAVNVQKTFTPDVPGDFAGGSLQLESREVPDEFMFEIGADVGVNTASTGRQFLTSRGFMGPDALAVGNVPRGLPSELPRNTPASRGVLDDNYNPIYGPSDIQRFGRSMLTDSRVRHNIAPPNWGLKATAGYGLRPNDDSKFGFLAAATYKNQFQTQRYDRFRQYALGGDGELAGTPSVDFKGRASTYTVSWSGVGLVKYDVDKRNQLSLLGFYSREADDEARELTGIARNVSGLDPIYNTRLRYIMRSVLVTRLGGKHEIPAARDLNMDWFGSYARAERDDPAIREMLFTDAGGDGTYRIDRGNDSGKQTFLHLVDDTESGAVNFGLPFKQWSQLGSKVKVGAWAEGKQRQFTVRRFQFQQDDVSLVPGGIGNVIRPDLIGGGEGDNAFFLQEGTRPTDNYEARQEVFAGYGMLQLPFVRWFEVVGGARYEANFMRVNPFDPFDPTATDPGDQGARLKDLDWLPSVSFIFSPTDKQKVRLVGAKTLARPEFRELAPFVFTDFVGGADVQGNPDLISTKIWNGDLRWEWFPSAAEVVAVSGFYKYFQNPIERIRVQAGSTQISSFNNAEAAHMAGAELEARKTLEFVSKKLDDLSVGTNFAYIFSRVTLGDRCDITVDPMCLEQGRLGEVSTNRTRPLQDQSPWVINTYLDYDNDRIGTNARVLYNVAGPRIAEVGGAGLPDIYRQPQHDLQFVFGQRIYKGLQMSFAVGNILNAPVYWTQSGRVVRRYYEGMDFSLGLSYSY